MNKKLLGLGLLALVVGGASIGIIQHIKKSNSCRDAIKDAYL